MELNALYPHLAERALKIESNRIDNNKRAW